MIAALPPAIVAGELIRLQTRQHVVALTFDGGGNADGAKGVLAVLRREHVKGTFFLTGHFVRAFPGLARAIGRVYPLGNHTVNHLDLRRMSTTAATWEIAQAAVMIERATGRDTHPYFRFPYGSRDARTLRIAYRLGYASVRWTVDTWGWMGPAGGMSKARVIQRVSSLLRPGDIMLLHVGANRDGSTLDADALPAILRLIERRGYRFVTLDRYVTAPR